MKKIVTFFALFLSISLFAQAGKRDNMPNVVALNASKDTLCYELRVYTATKGNLNNLLKRFRNHTAKLFEKHGMTNVVFLTPLDNPDEKLYYVLSYPNRAARETSWRALWRIRLGKMCRK